MSDRHAHSNLATTLGRHSLFVRIPPSDNLNKFCNLIINHFEGDKENRKEATRRLLDLMDSLCLHLTQDNTINLQEPPDICRDII